MRVWRLLESSAHGAVVSTRLSEEEIRTDKEPQQALIAKIRSLSPEKVAEVEDFVDFLRQRDADQRLTQAAARLSEDAFREVWDNPDDADYDQL